MRSSSRAEAYIQKIDEMGGALAAIEHGYIQGEIQNAAYEFQRAMERGEEIVVGVNAFQVEETDRPGAFEGRSGDRAGPARPAGSALRQRGMQPGSASC